MQPPNEPPAYQPSSPIPSPHTPPIGGYIPPQGPAQVNFDVISRAWELLKPNLGVWVGAAFVTSIVIGIVYAVTNLIANPGAFSVPMPAPGSSNIPPAIPMPNYPLLLVCNLIQFVVTQFLIGGMYRMAINQVRTGVANFGDMFSVTDVLPSLLGAAILTFIALCVGFVFCIVPMIILSGLFLFTIPLVVDKRMGSIDAIKTSMDTLKPQMGMAVAFNIVMGLLAGAGLCLCGVGVLITGPLAALSLALLYRDFFPERTLA